MKYFLHIIFLISFKSFSAGVLSFHVGVGGGQNYFVGGTIENKSSEIIQKSFIVIQIFEDKCTTGEFIFYEEGILLPGGKVNFKVPTGKPIKAYRILSIGGVDIHGKRVDFIDETYIHIKKNQDDDDRKCKFH
ncbi:hypothetical protein SAMN05428958_1214 [Pantoea sesami]|nr:hypothetical protein SAMN05428958_1214 [Pantoea sesami]